MATGVSVGCSAWCSAMTSRAVLCRWRSRISWSHSGKSLTILVPICALCVLIGVYPQPILETARPDVDIIARIADKARARAKVAAQKIETLVAAEK